MSTHKKVIYLPRAEVEQFVPPPRSHLISISDGETDRAQIDRSRWDSVSFHTFVDGGYDEGIVTACGAHFLSTYASYFLPESAQAMRDRIASIADQADLIVVNCIYGRSRSAAVARYIHEMYGFKIDKAPLEANMTVYRLLIQDPSLLMACRQARVAGEASDAGGEDMSIAGRISRWLGLGGTDHA